MKAPSRDINKFPHINKSSSPPSATSGGQWIRSRIKRIGGHKTWGMLNWLFSISMSEIELTTLQCSDQKKLDKQRRIRGAMDDKEFPLTKRERLSC